MTGAIGEFTIGDWGIDFSTPNYFKQLLARPSFDLVYLVELSPYDSDKVTSVQGNPPMGVNPIGVWDFSYQGGVETFYISDRGYVTNGADTPAHTNYRPSTNNAFQLDISVFDGEFTGRIGSFGAIRILNGGGYYDNFASYYWEGRGVKVYAGAPDFTREQFVKVFDGVCTGIEHEEAEFILNLQNNEQILETEFAQELYEGVGGLTGGDDLSSKPKPLLYGECLRFEPILVDAANLIYQVHDGAIQAIDALYDRGVELTSGGDVADITAASVSAGQFKTQLSGGYIKLGSSPDGLITCDAKGDAQGSYASKAGQIVTRILRTKLGSFNLGDAQIDQGAFNRVDQAVSGDIGIYITQETTARAVINEIFTPLQIFWTYNREGLITAGVPSSPSEPILELNENNIIDGDFRSNITYAPSWRINVGYAKRWRTQSEIAAGASEDYRTFAQEEYRTIINEKRNVRTLSASAMEKTFNTLLVNEADAITQSERVQELFGVKRKTYSVKVKGLLFGVFIGDSVTLKINRFGLDNGQDFLITGISEDAETNLTELELWG